MQSAVIPGVAEDFPKVEDSLRVEATQVLADSQVEVATVDSAEALKVFLAISFHLVVTRVTISGR